VTVVAAVDIGTNTTRLLLTDGERDLRREAVITRLGRGVDRNRRLDPAAVARTVEVLSGYGEAIRDAGAGRVRCIATSASRDADDREAFFDAAEAALGTRPELVTGVEEGRLTFEGATAGLDPADEPFLAVDIGGGSTEFAVADGVLSVDVGAVRLTEQWLRSDPPTAEELSQAIHVVLAHLEDVARELPATREARTITMVAGTATTVAAVEIGLHEWDRDAVHGFRLSRGAAEDVFRTLATEPLAERLHNPGLHPDRADVIVGGCCVLVATMRFFDAEEVVISDADLLDGIARRLLAAG
jgi:exopolyphosphatase / guanosine-5'-triphosphate,3'-diphosphate pyrophosphatase